MVGTNLQDGGQMMDCPFAMSQSKMRCRSWDWRIVVAFLAFFITRVNGAGECSTLMQDSIGYINSKGIVIKQVGSELVLDCVINQTVGSSANIVWRWNSSDIDGTNTEVIDDVTKRLTIPNTTMRNSGPYFCAYRNDEVNDTAVVCLVDVQIGVPPLQVENFDCISYYWRYMVCTWTVPENPVITTYSLSYYRSGLLIEGCKPRTNGNLRICNFTDTGGRHEIPYAPYEEILNFTLTAFNELGQKQTKFVVDHYTVVIPAPPYKAKFSVNLGGHRTGKISWRSDKQMIGFTHLVYQVAYRSEWYSPDNWTVVELPISEGPFELRLYRMIPYTNYTVRIQCISSIANRSDPKLWSEAVYISKRTHPDVPESAPAVTIGSFYVNQHVDNRSVIIFWKNVSEWQKFGKGFRYAWRMEDEYTGEEFNESDGGKGYALYPSLRTDRSYNFTVYSENHEGESQEKAYLRIEAHKNMPQVPAKLTIVAHGHGLYNVSWKPASNESMDIATYTVFWCQGVTNYINSCEGDIDWLVVDSSITSVNITRPDDIRRYRFAVSATNKHGVSSGMYWNTCIVSKDQTMGKMKDVGIKDVKASSFGMYWNLNCVEKLGILTGFVISYCPVIETQSEICTEPQRIVRVNDPDSVSSVISGVDVFTDFRVSIAAITVAGEGETSDFYYVRTNEGVPASVDDIIVTSVTNSSFVVNWKAPNKPNGVVTQYVLFDRDLPVATLDGPFDGELRFPVVGLDAFTNYSLDVSACTVVGCSRRKNPVDVRTKIGVPGQMQLPRIMHVNNSYITIQPEFDPKPRGPDNLWDLRLLWLDEANVSRSEEITNCTSENNKMRFINIDCSDKGQRVYEIQTRAVYYNGTERLQGEYSEPAKIPCKISTSAFPVAAIIGCAVAAVIICIVSCILYQKWKCARDKLREMCNFTPKIPIGLIRAQQAKENDYLGRLGGDLKGNLQPLKNGSVQRKKESSVFLGTNKLSNIDDRFRNPSGLSVTSEFSANGEEKHLLNDFPGHDSVGSSAQDSLSSGNTTLSYEGSAPNTPTAESPDSSSTIRADDLKETPFQVPVPADPTTHYATIAHYQDGNKDGYSRVSAVPASLGYVARQPSPDELSYSKLGSVYDADELFDGPPYSKFALADPINGLELTWGGPIPLESPKDFGETDSVGPYSCLGDRTMPGPSGYIPMAKVTGDPKTNGSIGGYIPQEAIGPYCQVSELSADFPPIAFDEPRVAFLDPARQTPGGVPAMSGNRAAFEEPAVDIPRPKSGSVNSYGHFSPEHQRFSTISSSSEV